MSMFEDGRYRWRETYFVLFSSGNRPTLKAVQKALAAMNEHYVLTNPSEDENGLFDSLTLLSSDDFAAMDICYNDGEEVLEQVSELAEQIKPTACEPNEITALKQIARCDARFDVLHFEEVPEFSEDEDGDEDEMLDPSALLLVLGELAKITGGVAIDPQSGSVISSDG